MNTRALSAKIIHRVCYKQRSLSDVFHDLLPQDADKAYIKSICFGTLRFWFELEDILSLYLDKPLKTKDKDIECLLIVGLYQLLHTETPIYAAINETVAGAKHLKKIWAKGLINKILRLVNENKPSLSTDKQYAHPTWLLNEIKQAWPTDWKAIVMANNQQAPLFLRINKTKITVDAFKALLNEADIPFSDIKELPGALKITNPLPVEKIPGFLAGLFCVQDLTGQKVIDYLSPKDNERVLDACCAPGSKTTHILESTHALQALISVDLSEKRLKQVTDNIHRLGLQNNILTLTAADMCDNAAWWDGKPFDRILIDAPCSATGVIRRHPDIKILRKASDIPSLAQIQLTILSTAWETLKSGGHCLYTTCSILPTENDHVIAQFLKDHPNATVKPINTSWGVKQEYGQQVLPGDRERDGFYYCCLTKN